MRGPPKNEVSQEFSLEGTFQADAIGKKGRRDNVRIKSVIGECGEDLYQKVVDIAEKARVGLEEDFISVCHKLPIRKTGPKTIIAKVVRRHTEDNAKANEKIERKQKEKTV